MEKSILPNGWEQNFTHPYFEILKWTHIQYKLGLTDIPQTVKKSENE